MTSAVVLICYLLIVRRKFFNPFFRLTQGNSMNWRREIMPMQWQLGLQSLVGYFSLSLFTPVMFYYYGPAVAGKMGMTWQIVTAIQSFSSLWFVTKTPKLGMMVVNRDFRLLDKKWRHSTLISIVIMVLLIFSACLLIELLNVLNWPAMQRLLSPISFLMLGIGAIFSQSIYSIAIYLRAHKREILTPISIPSAILIGLAVWQGGIYYGPLGSCIGYLTIISLVSFPLVLIKWQRFRHLW